MSDQQQIDPVALAKAIAAEMVAQARADSKPAAGGWAPPPWAPLAGALLVGILGALGSITATGGALNASSVIGAVCTGAATSLAGYFGIKSAGPRTP